MKEARWAIDTPARQPLGTVYVHLCSGQTREIDDVQGVTVTDADVIFDRGEGKAVVIPRSEIYYTCQQPGDTPSAY
jgi:hypothetical protein